MSRMNNRSHDGGGIGKKLSKGLAALNKGLDTADRALKTTDETLKRAKTVVQQTKRISGQAKNITRGQTGGMVPVKAKQVQPKSIVQTQAKDLKNQTMQVKQGSQVVQVKSLPPGQMVQAIKEEVRPEAQVFAKQQDVTLKAGQVAQNRPDLTVQAKPSDLKQSQVVLVDKTAVQPSQQERVIQVSSSKVLAKPAQLKQGQLVQVPVQNVTAAKQLHQTMEGLSTQKPRRDQSGGASSDFVGSFYANTVVGGPAAISAATLNGINTSPMFNPLNLTATFPTMPSTGIVPTGMVMSKMV